MKITIQKEMDAEILALGMFEEDKKLAFTDSLRDELSKADKSKAFTRKFGQMYGTKVSGRRVLVLGLGKRKEFTSEKLRRVLGKAVSHAKSHKASAVSTDIPAQVSTATKILPSELGRATSEGLLLGNYFFSKYLEKEKREKYTCLKKVNLVWAKVPGAFRKGLADGQVIAESTNYVKDLVNESAGVCTSTFMEKQARKVAAGSSKISLKVLNEPEMKKLGMGSLLGVNAGSQHPPKLMFLHYRGSKGPLTAILGKGITFDSGGYNIKPTKYIEDMKTDMGGSAAVLGTIQAAAKLGLRKNILGVMGMCENMVSHTAQHPGDIVRAYNGKTIEIGNTDAEGRLVLADALAYTEKKYKPALMIDMATLTGACVVALGYYAAGMVGTDEETMRQLTRAGESSGDRVWQLPFYEDYHDWMDGSISDLNNISQKGKGYEGGSITAGVFLSKFVDKAKWVHLDIAGSAYWSVRGDYVQKGATGSGVRVLTYYFMGE